MVLQAEQALLLSAERKILRPQRLQKGPAALLDVVPGGLKVAGIPGIGYVAGAIGIVEQKMYFQVRIAAEYFQHIAHIVLLHGDNQIEFFIIAFGDAPSFSAAAAYAVLGQNALGRRIYGIAQLFGAGGGRINKESVGEAGFSGKILHHKLRHRRAADIAVAYKEYFYQTFKLHIILISLVYFRRRQDIPGCA